MTTTITTTAIAGETVEVSALTLTTLSSVLPLLIPIIDASQAGAEANWLHALEANADKLAQALAIATDKPVDWVNALSYQAFIELAQSVFTAYADYLRRAAMPRISEG